MFTVCFLCCFMRNKLMMYCIWFKKHVREKLDQESMSDMQINMYKFCEHMSEVLHKFCY